MAVLSFKPLEHHLIGNRVDIRTKAPQLIAKTLRQNLRTIGQNLPHLYKHGTQLFDEAAQAHRRDVVPHLVLARKAENLAYAAATPLSGKLILLGGSHNLWLLGKDVNGARPPLGVRGRGFRLIHNRCDFGVERIVFVVALLVSRHRAATRPAPRWLQPQPPAQPQQSQQSPPSQPLQKPWCRQPNLPGHAHGPRSLRAQTWKAGAHGPR